MKSIFRICAVAIIAALICLAAVNIGSPPAQAAVTLLYFRGQHNGDSVLLEWATATELDTAYFYLERSDAQAGPYQMLNEIGIVPSEAPPDGLSGADYQRVDADNVQASNAYWYVLVEVESAQGAENRTQPIRVAVADDSSTSTPTRTPTRTPSATPTSTTGGSLSATPTATPGGTAVPIGSTATPGVVRTVSIRTTTTPEPGEISRNTVAGAGQNSGGQAAAGGQGQATAAASQTDQGAAAGAQVVAAQSDPDGYPGPATPEDLITRSYPAPAGPREQTNGDGTPVPNIGANSQAPAGGQQDERQAPGNSPALGTIFLWLGFAAALLVFISTAAGAIYYYSRQRSRDV